MRSGTQRHYLQQRRFPALQRAVPDDPIAHARPPFSDCSSGPRPSAGLPPLTLQPAHTGVSAVLYQEATCNEPACRAPTFLLSLQGAARLLGVPSRLCCAFLCCQLVGCLASYISCTVLEQPSGGPCAYGAPWATHAGSPKFTHHCGLQRPAPKLQANLVDAPGTYVGPKPCTNACFACKLAFVALGLSANSDCWFK
jgi:hypothetical protein